MSAIQWHIVFGVLAYIFLTPGAIFFLLRIKPELCLTKNIFWLICFWWLEVAITIISFVLFHISRIGGKT